MSYEKNLDVVVVDIIGVVPKSIIRIAKKSLLLPIETTDETKFNPRARQQAARKKFFLVFFPRDGIQDKLVVCGWIILTCTFTQIFLAVRRCPLVERCNKDQTLPRRQ